MYKAIIYNKTIKGKTVSELFRKASRIANNYYNVIDKIIIFDSVGIPCEFTRINHKYPNNTIKRGKWR